MKTTNWFTRLGGSEFKVMKLQESPVSNDVLDCPELVERQLRPMLANSLMFRPDVENFIVVHLNTRKRMIGFEVVSNGTLDTLLVHPREVFKSAIVANSASIILVHNHPSGDTSPSDADVKVTRDLIRAGQIMKIDVVDHIVLGVATPEQPKGYASLRELGYFNL